MTTAPIAPPMAHDVIGNIGNTPLLRLEKVTRAFPGIEIYGKAEYFNPGGSVKDRAALNMILEGERAGLLTPEKILIDSTSGNTGIAYAMIGAMKGYQVKLCLPQNASPERKQILKAYGAEMVFTDPGEGSDGAIRPSAKSMPPIPTVTFIPISTTTANWQAHFEGTGSGDHRADRRPRHAFRRLLGTSGTFMGTSRRLKQDIPGVQCISAQPSTGFHGLEGMKHMPTAIVPGIYDPTLADRNILDRDRRRLRDDALAGSRRRRCWWACRRAATSRRRLQLAAELHGRGTQGRDRDGALRWRRQISERAFLGRRILNMISIERQPWREMVAHAEATYPNECCGAMIGTIDGDNKTVVHALALENASAGAQAARYELRPEDLLRADREARERRMDLIGIYHSHPDCDAYFSETDLKNSCPWYSFVVLSIQNGEFDHANSWLPNAEQTDAEKEELIWPKS